MKHVIRDEGVVVEIHLFESKLCRLPSNGGEPGRGKYLGATGLIYVSTCPLSSASAFSSAGDNLGGTSVKGRR